MAKLEWVRSMRNDLPGRLQAHRTTHNGYKYEITRGVVPGLYTVRINERLITHENGQPWTTGTLQHAKDRCNRLAGLSVKKTRPASTTRPSQIPGWQGKY